MKRIFTLIFAIHAITAIGQQQFAASTIPEELKEKAHAVVRFHETHFVVDNIGEASNVIKGAITILDEKGDSFSTLVIPYNVFTKIKDIEAQVYDANGKQIKKLKRSDIESFSGSSGSNTIDDSYFKMASLSQSQYPYTVAFRMEYTTKNMMFYPSWDAYLYNQEHLAVEKSSFRIATPNDMQIRYKEINMPTKVKMERDGNLFVHFWEVSNLKALESEPLSPDLDSVMPQVLTAPTDFSVQDYVGRINNWDDVAKFIAKMNKDRDKLPEPLVQKVKELVKNETDVSQKVKKVYEFLQANTRYVSIQLGIGGWQTMKAEDVFEKGYGDCKALSNYTMAMLNALGIKSHQVLVKAGDDENDIHTDFPSFQFNHVFVCVPTAKDTLWLECTSQSNPFGYLGTFTSDRHVVVINDNGGNLVKTPTYSSNDNKLIRKSSIQLQDSGEAIAKVLTKYTGEQYETHSGVLNSLSNEDQKKWLYKQMSLPSVEINAFNLKENRDKIPSITEDLDLKLRNVATKSGTRLFVTPNLFNRFETAPLPNPNRKFDLKLSLNYVDTDSTVFDLPKGYSPEYIPEPVTIQSKFGVYKSTIEVKGDKLVYFRSLSMKKGQYPAMAYNEYADFRKKILKADKNQAVLVLK